MILILHADTDKNGAAYRHLLESSANTAEHHGSRS